MHRRNHGNQIAIEPYRKWRLIVDKSVNTWLISSRETKRGRRVTRLTHTGNINVDRMILCELWIIAAIAITRVFFMNRITLGQYKDIKTFISRSIDIHSSIFSKTCKISYHEKLYMHKHVINKREIIENYVFRLCNCYVIKTVEHSNICMKLLNL